MHAPYVINVASSNNKIRIPSRKILANHAAAAAALGAQGLVVHGGHVTKGEDPASGVENWVKTIERVELPLPVLVENTAGGDAAMARHLDAIARLWDGIGHHEQVGFCLDTCHSHAGGEELVTIVEKVRAITGRIDLVHCNDSRDAFDSGADRHANLGSGQIEVERPRRGRPGGRLPGRRGDPGRRPGRRHRAAALPPVGAGSGEARPEAPAAAVPGCKAEAHRRSPRALRRLDSRSPRAGC